MVGRGTGRARGNQGQQTELTEMWRMIDELSRAVQALQRQGHVGARMEIPEGDHDPFDMPEGGLEDELEEGGKELPDPIYDEYNDEDDDVDIYPAQGESLIVRRVLATTSETSKLNGFLTVEEFEDKGKEAGVVFAVISKVTNSVGSDGDLKEQPVAVQRLLDKFAELVGETLPQDLPPMRSIQHALNKITIPIPCLEDMLDHLAGSKIFTRPRWKQKFRARVPRHAIIKTLAGEEISKLEDLIYVLSKLSWGARAPLEYKSYMDRHRRKSVLVTVDRHEWYATPQIYTRDDNSSLWTAKPAFQPESMLPSSSVNGEATHMEHIHQDNHQELTNGFTSIFLQDCVLKMKKELEHGNINLEVYAEVTKAYSTDSAIF